MKADLILKIFSKNLAKNFLTNEQLRITRN